MSKNGKSGSKSVTVKRGRSGTLVFVRVRHLITRNGANEPALTEFHDIVYREAAVPGAPAPAPQAAPEQIGRAHV